VLNVRTVLTYTDFGLGSAYSWVITIVTLVISIGYISTLYQRGRIEV
jgi:multiple sugar transport system permease protein